MGLVYADIELVRTIDLVLHQEGALTAEQVRSVKARALVDSGATMMAINETIRRQLDLNRLDEQIAELADGTTVKLDVVGPLDVRFKNRSTTLRAIVMPGNVDVLLGAIAMEDMDVLIDPKRQELIVNPAHPYIAQKPLK